MAEELKISGTTDKEQKYANLLPQIKALIADEPNIVANMANVAAALKQVFNFFWVGFYIVDESSLVLGPFQGPIACTRIAKKKGVCGAAWVEKDTILVSNVDEYPGHIACSSGSKSEIVVPGMDDHGNVQFVLDVDSEQLNHFDNSDKKNLNEVVKLIINNK